MPGKRPSAQRTFTPADRQAATRLKALWLAAVARRRGSENELTQAVMADTLARYTGRGTQGAISQYVNGDLALNFKAVLAFADEIGCEPEEIRGDLPEQRTSRAILHQQADPRTQGQFNSQVENDVDALAYAISTLYAVIAAERPAEAARIATAMRDQIPDQFAHNGLVKKLIAKLEKGARRAKIPLPASSS